MFLRVRAVGVLGRDRDGERTQVESVDGAAGLVLECVQSREPFTHCRSDRQECPIRFRQIDPRDFAQSAEAKLHQAATNLGVLGDCSLSIVFSLSEGVELLFHGVVELTRPSIPVVH
jgi:hypothetical protein